MKILTLLLLFSLPSLGQTFTVIDDSPSDSPITLRGTVTIDPINTSNNACFLIGHNWSSKSAVAWRTDIDIASPQGGTQHGTLVHDRLFEDQDVLLALSPEPNSDYNPTPLDIDCRILTGGFHVRTLWVQFLDGSTWSDPAYPDAQAYVMAQRTNALDLLNALKSAYSNDGATAFQDVLSSYKHSGQTTQDTLRRDKAYSTKLRLTKIRGVTAEVAEVNRMLSVAGTRSAWLRPQHHF